MCLYSQRMRRERIYYVSRKIAILFQKQKKERYCKNTAKKILSKIILHVHEINMKKDNT